jgi:phospholipase C
MRQVSLLVGFILSMGDGGQNMMKAWQLILIFMIGLCFFGCRQESGAPPTGKAHRLVEMPKIWSKINKVVIVVLENTDFDEAIGQPFLSQLSQKGAILTSYFGITHPSQPNYLALVAGDTFGVDNKNVNLGETHIGDLLETAGKTWKSYAEGYPGGCFLKANSGDYARRHEPFLSFKNVTTNPARCKNIVNADQFKLDLKAQSLPNLSFYVPDVRNDGHDTGVAFADKWLSGFLTDISQVPKVLEDTLFIVTFDEGSGGGDNRVVTIFYGAGVKPGATSDQHYHHYSLLKTIEGIFGLSTLGKYDQTASPIDDIWLENR